MVSKTEIRFYFLTRNSLKKDSEACWKNEWGSEIIMAHGSSNSCGVAILVKKGVDCTIHSKILDPLGRYVILKAEINNKMYVLINVYAPNKDANIIKFLNNLLMTLRKNNFDEEENIIIGGDFNCPPNPILDMKGGLLIQRKSVVIRIENLQEELDLVDIWRVRTLKEKALHEAKILQ